VSYTIKHENVWPINTTRFLFPAIAIRGLNGKRSIAVAFWSWRVWIEWERQGGNQ
jgi:hypothetical protein